MSRKIAFVVITWNSEKYIEGCLESVLSLEGLCLEIQVVDNGSTDDTLCILRRMSAANQKLRVTELSENVGTTKSRNIALRNLSDEATYVCILDSDTVVSRDAFEAMLSKLEEDSSIGVIGPSMYSTEGELQLSGRNLPTLLLKMGKAFPFGFISDRAASAEMPKAPIVNNLQDVGYLLSACWLIPLSALKKVGEFDEHIFYAPEDVDWCVRCHDTGLRVCYCPEARITHAYQRIGHKKLISRVNIEHVKGLAYYFKKHHYVFRAPIWQSESRR